MTIIHIFHPSSITFYGYSYIYILSFLVMWTCFWRDIHPKDVKKVRSKFLI